jgi:hypothetical protein
MSGAAPALWGWWAWESEGIRCSVALAAQLGLSGEVCPWAQWWERVPLGERVQAQQAWRPG